MAKINFKKIAIKAGGAAAGGAASQIVGEKFLASMDPKIKAAIQVVGGAVITELAPKNDFVNAAGMGMSGVGGANLVNAFLPAKTSGIADDFLDDDISGDSFPTDDDSDMSGTDESPISGTDDDENISVE